MYRKNSIKLRAMPLTVDEWFRFVAGTTTRMSTLVTGPPGASKAYKRDEEHLNWTWLHGKKKAVMDAAKGLLVAFVAASRLSAYGCTDTSGTRPNPENSNQDDESSSSPEVEALKDAVDGQSFGCLPKWDSAA